MVYSPYTNIQRKCPEFQRTRYQIRKLVRIFHDFRDFKNPDTRKPRVNLERTRLA